MKHQIKPARQPTQDVSHGNTCYHPSRHRLWAGAKTSDATPLPASRTTAGHDDVELGVGLKSIQCDC
ncbi:hypothetical protein RJ55_05480 [Drechmeria coniospora]|nr:hypothetical protein RJ55_05480 [Drechmeria coniospora]